MKKKIFLNVLMVLFIAVFGAAVLSPVYSQYDGSGAFGNVANWVKGFLKSGQAVITANTLTANTVTATNGITIPGASIMSFGNSTGLLSANAGVVTTSGTSANIASVISDETGTGSLVMANNATLNGNVVSTGNLDVAGNKIKVGYNGDGITTNSANNIAIVNGQGNSGYNVNLANANQAISSLTGILSLFGNLILQPSSYTVATMPNATLYPNAIVVVKDGANTADCGTGNGANAVLCWSNGVIYTNVY